MRNYRARSITKSGKPVFAERHEHLVVAHWLNLHGLWWIHVPNEGKRNVQTGRLLRLMGMRRGCPDFIIFDPPTQPTPRRGTVLELKALDGREPTADQLEFLSEMGARGWASDWYRGADAAIEWLTALGYGKR